MAPQWRKITGIVLLDKAVGVSSNHALQQVRRLFRAEKAGHTGSLDPLASGMLPICLGEATKISSFLLDANKHYVTAATLGQTSSTGDAEGEISPPRPIPPLDAALLEAVLTRFRGTIQQIPPMYSALKQDGQPLYKLARQGREVERAPRQVTIHTLQLLGQTTDTLTLEVRCSKGTYIRTLVEDIGTALGCGAYVSMLRRLAVDPFAGQPMYTMAQLQALAEQGDGTLEGILLPLDRALPHLPALDLPQDTVERLRQGQRVRLATATADAAAVRLYAGTGEFVGLGEIRHHVLHPKRLLAY